MSIFSRSLLHRRPQHQQQSCRTFVEAKIKWVRDRGLDHAVEKEKNLKPMLALKNLIKSEPSKSIPVSVAAEHRDTLSLPTRAIEFIRRFPSIFEEFLPGGVGVRPHVRLTPEILSLDQEEHLIFASESYRREAADRLLKLLMLTRINKLPLHIIDRLRFDLGLPHDYIRTLVPDYPEYFQITSIKNSQSGAETLALELVCWSKDLAISAMEKKAMNNRVSTYKKGMPIAFDLQFSRGFDLEKKVKRWVDEWQKLPYISPYENALHLQPKSDQAEKWAVAVLHELLHLLVPKKTESDTILLLGEQLGLRSRFKRALTQHVGIFYLSNKIRTHTVILREAYKRDLLVEKHPLMGLRYQYIHLMNKVNDQIKSTSAPDASPRRTNRASKEGEGAGEGEEEEGDDEGGEEHDDLSSEVEDASDNYDDSEDEEDDNGAGACKSVIIGRGRTTPNVQPQSRMRRPSRSSFQARSTERYSNKVEAEVPVTFSRRTESVSRHTASARPLGRSSYPNRVGRPDRRRTSTT